MKTEWLIVDGYNLLHLEDGFGISIHDLQHARQQLVREVERVLPEMAIRATVVFDGQESGRDWALETSQMEVVFSPSNRTADAVIERMVADSDHPEHILVVTSDRVEEQIVSAAGAMVLSCQEFVRRCQTPSHHATNFHKPRGQSRGTLGDFFPESAE